STMSRRFVLFLIPLGLAAAGLLGCKPAPKQADPQSARETLNRALQAWQKGQSLEAFQKTSPVVKAAESQWQQGVRLVEFELKGEGKPSGFDHQFTVQMSTQDRAGKKSQETAIYHVSTSPALVIIRSQEG